MSLGALEVLVGYSKLWICTVQSSNLRNSGFEVLKVAIPKISTDPGVAQISSLIPELCKVGMLLIVGILHYFYCFMIYSITFAVISNRKKHHASLL